MAAAGLDHWRFVAGDPAHPAPNRIEWTYAGLFGRDGDTVGIGLRYERVSSTQRDLAADFSKLTSLVPPQPDFESVLEISNQAQVASWWILQPDLHWMIHLGGRVLNFPDPRANLGAGAVVLGLRTAISL